MYLSSTTSTMGKKILFPVFFCFALNVAGQQKRYTPDQVYGQLFNDVQIARVFPDGKTFVDCIPKRNPKDIMYDYGLMKGPKMDLKKFVEDNFELPHVPQLNYVTQEKDVVMHIKNLWGVLKRDADVVVTGEGWAGSHNSSLLPLPGAYIVPGGRFREIYYWDSYFTMLGLKESGETAMIESMIKNFAFLIDNYGHIPNGSRTYYLSRSQPPFFSLMVELLAEIKGDSVYQQFLPQLEKEYAFWMSGVAKLKPGEATARAVPTSAPRPRLALALGRRTAVRVGAVAKLPRRGSRLADGARGDVENAFAPAHRHGYRDRCGRGRRHPPERQTGRRSSPRALGAWHGLRRKSRRYLRPAPRRPCRARQ